MGRRVDSSEPRLRFPGAAEVDACGCSTAASAPARARAQREHRDSVVWEGVEAERPSLLLLPCRLTASMPRQRSVSRAWAEAPAFALGTSI